MNEKKQVSVIFGEQRIENEFEALIDGKFQDKQLHKYILRAIDDMKADPACGIKIPKRLWPRIYVLKYTITNLWKYDLPNGWRLVYTIKEDEVIILNVILEWFDHKEYERRFGY